MHSREHVHKHTRIVTSMHAHTHTSRARTLSLSHTHIYECEHTQLTDSHFSWSAAYVCIFVCLSVFHFLNFSSIHPSTSDHATQFVSDHSPLMSQRKTNGHRFQFLHKCQVENYPQQVCDTDNTLRSHAAPQCLQLSGGQLTRGNRNNAQEKTTG